MINITWGNLMPPRCSQAYIVNFLLAPSFFNNPDLGKSIQESSFYQRKDGTILDALNNVKAFRSRLFNFGDSPKTSEKLINLLLLKTKQDNIAYTLDTFPIRHEFKKQWKFFLKEYFGDQYSIYLEDYKKYIHLFLEDNYTIEDFEAEADTDFFKRVKSDRRDFQKNKKAARRQLFRYDIQFFRFRITSPLSRARTASSVRFLKPVFSSIFRMCVLTVATDMCSRSAIS